MSADPDFDQHACIHCGQGFVRIIKQTCLKAAAEFCASRPELKSADLLALAERMEAWVTRD